MPANYSSVVRRVDGDQLDNGSQSDVQAPSPAPAPVAAPVAVTNAVPVSSAVAPAPLPLDVAAYGPPYRYLDATAARAAWSVQQDQPCGGDSGVSCGWTAFVYDDLANAQSDFLAGVRAGDPTIMQCDLLAIDVGSPNEITPANHTPGWDPDYAWGSTRYKSFALTLGRALGLADADTAATINGAMAQHFAASFGTSYAPFELGNSKLGAEFAGLLVQASGVPASPSLLAAGSTLDAQYAAQRAVQAHDGGLLGGGFGMFLFAIATAGIASYAYTAYAAAAEGASTVIDGSGAVALDANAATAATADSVTVAVPSGVQTVATDAGVTAGYTSSVDVVGDAVVVTAHLVPEVAAPALTATDVVAMGAGGLVTAAATAAPTPSASTPLDASSPSPALDQAPSPDTVVVTGHLPVVAPAPVLTTTDVVALGAGGIAAGAPTQAQLGVQSGDPYYSTQTSTSPLDGSTPSTPLDQVTSGAKTAASVVSAAGTAGKLLTGAGSSSAAAPSTTIVTRGVTPAPIVYSDAAGGLFGSGISGTNLTLGLTALAISALFFVMPQRSERSNGPRPRSAPKPRARSTAQSPAPAARTPRRITATV